MDALEFAHASRFCAYAADLNPDSASAAPAFEDHLALRGLENLCSLASEEDAAAQLRDLARTGLLRVSTRPMLVRPPWPPREVRVSTGGTGLGGTLLHLHVLSRAPGARVVAALARDLRVDPNARDFLGRTALHYACDKKELPAAAVRALLECGADPLRGDAAGLLPAAMLQRQAPAVARALAEAERAVRAAEARAADAEAGAAGAEAEADADGPDAAAALASAREALRRASAREADMLEVLGLLDLPRKALLNAKVAAAAAASTPASAASAATSPATLSAAFAVAAAGGGDNGSALGTPSPSGAPALSPTDSLGRIDSVRSLDLGGLGADADDSATATSTAVAQRRAPLSPPPASPALTAAGSVVASFYSPAPALAAAAPFAFSSPAPAVPGSTSARRARPPLPVTPGHGAGGAGGGAAAAEPLHFAVLRVDPRPAHLLSDRAAPSVKVTSIRQNGGAAAAAAGAPAGDVGQRSSFDLLELDRTASLRVAFSVGPFPTGAGAKARCDAFARLWRAAAAHTLKHGICLADCDGRDAAAAAAGSGAGAGAGAGAVAGMGAGAGAGAGAVAGAGTPGGPALRDDDPAAWLSLCPQRLRRAPCEFCLTAWARDAVRAGGPGAGDAWAAFLARTLGDSLPRCAADASAVGELVRGMDRALGRDGEPSFVAREAPRCAECLTLGRFSPGLPSRADIGYNKRSRELCDACRARIAAAKGVADPGADAAAAPRFVPSRLQLAISRAEQAKREARAAAAAATAGAAAAVETTVPGDGFAPGQDLRARVGLGSPRAPRAGASGRVARDELDAEAALRQQRQVPLGLQRQPTAAPSQLRAAVEAAAAAAAGQGGGAAAEAPAGPGVGARAPAGKGVGALAPAGTGVGALAPAGTGATVEIVPAGAAAGTGTGVVWSVRRVAALAVLLVVAALGASLAYGGGRREAGAREDAR